MGEVLWNLLRCYVPADFHPSVNPNEKYAKFWSPKIVLVLLLCCEVASDVLNQQLYGQRNFVVLSHLRLACCPFLAARAASIFVRSTITMKVDRYKVRTWKYTEDLFYLTQVSRVFQACVNSQLLGIFFKTNVTQIVAELILHSQITKIVAIFYQICWAKIKECKQQRDST